MLGNPIATITCDYEGCDRTIEIQPTWEDAASRGYSWHIASFWGRILLEENLKAEAYSTAALFDWLVDIADKRVSTICPEHTAQYKLDLEFDKIKAAEDRICAILYQSTRLMPRWWEKLRK